mgnify:CR=1 FL=1
MKNFLMVLLTVFAAQLFAAENQYQFNSAEEEQLFRQLTAELRCPKCQNQNIADSDAVVAKDLRDKVLELVQEGNTKDQVVDYMIDRYGYFVHYKPPVTPLTLLLWVLPLGFVLLGFVLILLKQKKQAQSRSTWTDADEQKLSKLIAKYKEVA